MQLNTDNDFLGRLWVPATLLMIAVAVVVSAASSLIVLGFALAEVTAAMSIMLRLTWDRRGVGSYRPIVLVLLVIHLISVAVLLSSLTRAPGGVYMLTALVDAFLMTFIVRSLTRG